MRRWSFLLPLLCAIAASAQNHPELEWQVLESEHFRVLFHQGLERAAARAAAIGEEAYGPITRLYGYQPSGKVRLLLKDHDDYANGAAYFYQDLIEIWGTALDHDYELRGTSDWLRNVITHEFTHLISLGAARKGPQRVPALYLQYFGYQRERDRPDVLTGYPDVMASYPVVSTVVPMWFAEGVAQYQAEGVRRDRWDSHRDMILRVAVLDTALLSLEEMGVFEKRHFGNEFVYDHGYALVRYIAARYGDERLATLCRSMSEWPTLDFGRACQQALGISAPALYRDWRDDLRARYQAQVESLGPRREGEAIPDQGFSNLRPVCAPDGKRLAYLSTRQRDYGPHALVLRHLDTGKEEVLVAGAVSGISWAPDGRRLLFVRREKADPYGSEQADLYEWDLDRRPAGIAAQALWLLPAAVSDWGPEPRPLTRLTRGARALYPAYSPDGRWIAFVHNQGTRNQLGLMRADGTGARYYSPATDTTEYYTPRWSPDGRSLAFSFSTANQRDIALVPVALPDSAAGSEAVVGGPMQVLVSSPGTDRDPTWSADGRQLVFASDATGIFNLYALELATGQVRQLTNVLGGALSPTCGPDGHVVYSSYEKTGYRLRQIATDGAPLAGVDFAPRAPLATGTADPQPDRPARPYGGDLLKTSLLPRLLVDEGRLKAGLYVSAGDAVGRQSVFAGGAVAPGGWDRDLFSIYEYRRWRPTVALEFYHQRRHSARGDSSEARDLMVTGVDYNLSQIVLAVRGRVGDHGQLEASGTYDRYDASVASDAFEPRADGRPGFQRVRQKPFGYTYLNGLGLGLTYRFESVARRRDQEINPRSGRRFYVRYDRAFNYFIRGFNPNASFLQEEYLHLFYHQLTADWNEYVALPWSSTLGLRFAGGWLASRAVDDQQLVGNFFDYHLGGLPYMKGYTFYSLEGRKAAMAGATLRFPLLPDVGRRCLHLYLDKLYGAVYGDVGKAWDGDWDTPDPLTGRRGPRRDLGGQLRLDLVSYYSMPTRVQADLAYGVDEVAGRSPWKFYLTVLFGYL